MPFPVAKFTKNETETQNTSVFSFATTVDAGPDAGNECFNRASQPVVWGT